MRSVTRSVLLAACLALAAPAQSAPVQTQAILTVDIGFGSAPVTIGGFGTVDVTGSTVTVPAGLVTLGAAIVIPVTSTTSLGGDIGRHPALFELSNLAATFSIGGVTNQLPAEVCAGGPAPGEACNVGGGVGGMMGLTGRMRLADYEIFSVPVGFGTLLIGEGGSTNVWFGEIDAAAWSTGTGLVGRSAGSQGWAGAGSPLSLVSPVFVRLLGLEYPIVTRLTLTAVSLPVPEASVGLLIGSVGLALAVWKRS